MEVAYLLGEVISETFMRPPPHPLRVSMNPSDTGCKAIANEETVAVGGGNEQSFCWKEKGFPPSGSMSVLHSAGGTRSLVDVVESFCTLEGG